MQRTITTINLDVMRARQGENGFEPVFDFVTVIADNEQDARKEFAKRFNDGIINKVHEPTTALYFMDDYEFLSKSVVKNAQTETDE